MKKIVALGGGEIGRPGFPVETTEIDSQIIRLTGKSHPRLLFIPTASSDSSGYFNVVQEHFGKRLGCQVSVLNLIKDRHTTKSIRKMIFSSDIIYVGGGNTLKMMTIWRRLKVDMLLEQAYKKGIVMSGVSAGAICWFRFGNSDSRKFTSASHKLIKVSGLGLVSALLCPHYDFEPHRQTDLKRMMKRTPLVAIALYNCCAIEIVDDRYRILRSKPSAKALKIYWKGGRFIKEEIAFSKSYARLDTLLNRN